MLLFPAGVTPIEARLERIRAISRGHALISEGSGGIWTLLRQAPEGDVIHLVNLNGVGDAQWRDPAVRPTVKTNVTLRYRVDDPRAVTRVSWATPDEGPGTFSALEFERGKGNVMFTVPAPRVLGRHFSPLMTLGSR
jgi:hypothetical protein